VKVYSGSACVSVGQVGYCEGVEWECVWFVWTGRAL